MGQLFYADLLELAERIAAAWTALWQEDVANAAPHRSCYLRDADEADCVAAAPTFLYDIGENMWGAIAGFVVDGDVIAILPDAETDSFVVCQSREPDERAVLANVISPTIWRRAMLSTQGKKAES